MALEEKLIVRTRSYSRLTVLAVVLLLAVGAVVIVLDRKKFAELFRASNWSLLTGAVVLAAVSYLAGSYSFILIMRSCGCAVRSVRLFGIGLTSMVLLNLIGQPAGLSLRLLLMGQTGFRSSDTLAASVLLSYFKNLLYFALIPLSLLYILLSHPLRGFGIATILAILVLLVALLGLATGILFNQRLRKFTLELLAQFWYRLARRDIHPYLTQLSQAITSGIANLKKNGGIRLPLALSILVDVLATIAALWFCFIALGIPVHPGVLITGFNFGVTLTIISFIPGDMGVQEASVAGVVALFGVPFSQGVIAAILFRIIYYFVPFILTLPVYWSLLHEKKPA